MEIHVSPTPAVATAAADQALSRSLLDRVAHEELDGALRIWKPVPVLALSRLDELRDGAAVARELASAAGFEAITRISGGHAVVLGNGSLCVGIAEAAATFERTRDRYERLTAAVIDALQAVGIDAEQGELEGEWCPGAWSVRSGGVKLAGLAQRAIKGGGWAEAVIELAPDPTARDLLGQVYEALELPLDQTTIGSVSELTGTPTSFDRVADPLLSALSAG